MYVYIYIHTYICTSTSTSTSNSSRRPGAVRAGAGPLGRLQPVTGARGAIIYIYIYIYKTAK